MKTILFFIFLGLFNAGMAQVLPDMCANEDPSTLKSVSLNDFIDISNEPIKHVRVNFIFLRKNDGTGGFQENNPDHQQYINDMISNLNTIYSSIPSNYDPTCYNGTYGTYSDSKIRFDVDTMYLDDTYAWNNENSSYMCPGYSGYHLTTLNNQIAQNSSEPAINVFFTEDESAYQNIIVNQNCPVPDNVGFTSVCCSEYPEFSNLGYNQSVHMRNKYLKYYWMMNCVVGNNCNYPEWENDPPTEEEAYSWLGAGNGVAHELAHSLDLYHVSHNNCDDCIQHLMNNTHCRIANFLSPLEIGTMHKALSLSSARKYVPADTYSSTPFSISQNKTWDDDMRIYRGINVNNGAILEILDNLIVPSETEITVTGGSELIIGGSNITTPHTNSSLSITFNQNSTASIENSSIENCDVNVESANLTLDNSTIELGVNSEFVINSGSEFLMTNSTVQ